MNWFLVGYDAFAFFGTLTVVYVMVKTGHDRINAVAPFWLREMRRAFLAITALLVLFSIAEEASYFSLVILVIGGLINFAVNAVALYLRSRPPNDGGYELLWNGQPSAQFGHYISKADVERLDRGQRYTHDLLESILRNQELRPDSAIVVPMPLRKQ